MQYLRKPEACMIEARLFTADEAEQNSIADWCGGSIKGVNVPAIDRWMELQTLNGPVEVHIDDYVAEDAADRFYPISPEVMEAIWTPMPGRDLIKLYSSGINIAVDEQLEPVRVIDEWRWTRYSHGNNKIIGASSEAYDDKQGALDNIIRTQRQPYFVRVIDPGDGS